MIAFLKGQILEIHENSCTVLTPSGVGYEVHINEVCYSQLINKKEAELHIYHHITEAQQSLFGFVYIEEKKLFIELIKISGVGGKVALNILSLGSDRLAQAIALEDNRAIEAIKGIGKKMAEKIILELKDKDFVTMTSPQKNQVPSNISPLTQSQLIETLTNMGYSKDAIAAAINTLPEGMESMDDILPFIIKNI